MEAIFNRRSIRKYIDTTTYSFYIKEDGKAEVEVEQEKAEYDSEDEYEEEEEEEIEEA